MSFANLYYHIMFHTKYNAMAINVENERILYSYINGFCNNYGVKLLRLGGMPDHIHMLVNMPTTVSVSDFVKQLKVATSKMLYQDGHFPYFEGWQNGYSAFTFAYKDIEMIVNYIKGQKEHHKVFSFRDEYRKILIENGISPDEPFFPK